MVPVRLTLFPATSSPLTKLSPASLPRHPVSSHRLPFTVFRKNLAQRALAELCFFRLAAFSALVLCVLRPRFSLRVPSLCLLAFCPRNTFVPRVPPRKSSLCRVLATLLSRWRPFQSALSCAATVCGTTFSFSARTPVLSPSDLVGPGLSLRPVLLPSPSQRLRVWPGRSLCVSADQDACAARPRNRPLRRRHL